MGNILVISLWLYILFYLLSKSYILYLYNFKENINYQNTSSQFLNGFDIFNLFKNLIQIVNVTAPIFLFITVYTGLLLKMAFLNNKEPIFIMNLLLIFWIEIIILLTLITTFNLAQFSIMATVISLFAILYKPLHNLVTYFYQRGDE